MTVFVNFVSRDLQTTTGMNLMTGRECAGLDLWLASPSWLKQAVIDKETVQVVSEDIWRLEYL